MFGRFAYISELIFSNWQMYSVTKSYAIKRSIQMQNRPMNFNLPEQEKFTDDMFSDYNRS